MVNKISSSAKTGTAAVQHGTVRLGHEHTWRLSADGQPAYCAALGYLEELEMIDLHAHAPEGYGALHSIENACWPVTSTPSRKEKRYIKNKRRACGCGPRCRWYAAMM
jgi:hypothetical protein